jgi:hypothetical protein
MKVGDLVKFDYVNGHTSAINNKVAIYLGPKPLKREDGKIINNFMVQFVGDPVSSLCDGTLMRWLKVI